MAMVDTVVDTAAMAVAGATAGAVDTTTGAVGMEATVVATTTGVSVGHTLAQQGHSPLLCLCKHFSSTAK
jgi:hypothetical protein